MNNCTYHLQKEAWQQCPNCKKPICNDCYNLFKSHICPNCVKDMSINKLTKPFVCFLITLALLIFFIFAFNHQELFMYYDKYDKKSEFIFENWFLLSDISKSIDDIFYSVKVFLLNYNLWFIKIDDETLMFAFKIYYYSCFPLCYLFLTKILGIGIIRMLLKIAITLAISPIITPIAVVFWIVSIIKNISIIRKCNKLIVSDIES